MSLGIFRPFFVTTAQPENKARLISLWGLSLIFFKNEWRYEWIVPA